MSLVRCIRPREFLFRSGLAIHDFGRNVFFDSRKLRMNCEWAFHSVCLSHFVTPIPFQPHENREISMDINVLYSLANRVKMNFRAPRHLSFSHLPIGGLCTSLLGLSFFCCFFWFIFSFTLGVSSPKVFAYSFWAPNVCSVVCIGLKTTQSRQDRTANEKAIESEFPFLLERSNWNLGLFLVLNPFHFFPGC